MTPEELKKLLNQYYRNKESLAKLEQITEDSSIVSVVIKDKNSITNIILDSSEFPLDEYSAKQIPSLIKENYARYKERLKKEILDFETFILTISN